MQQSHLKKSTYTKCLKFRPPEPVHSYVQLDIDPSRFATIRNELHHKLKTKAENYFFTGENTINPLPILVSESKINEYKNIQEALASALQAIITNYFNDKRIRSAFDLDQEVKNILEMYRTKPYETIGSYRLNIFYY